MSDIQQQPAATQPAPPARPRAPRPPPVSVTPAAMERVRALLAKRGKPSYGVRVGVRTRGCSGLSYTLEYADAAEPGDEELSPADDIRILIAPKAAMFLFGTEMDFVEEQFKSGFTFRNPNEKGRCGCGESFHV
ncbi:MAG: HesB/IscA family protein [Alphaproteobacteria bacterium]|jgi:iron-sulfur cluster assembly protein